MGDDSQSWVGIVPVVMLEDYEENFDMREHAQSGCSIFGRKCTESQHLIFTNYIQ